MVVSLIRKVTLNNPLSTPLSLKRDSVDISLPIFFLRAIKIKRRRNKRDYISDK